MGERLRSLLRVARGRHLFPGAARLRGALVIRTIAGLRACVASGTIRGDCSFGREDVFRVMRVAACTRAPSRQFQFNQFCSYLSSREGSRRLSKRKCGNSGGKRDGRDEHAMCERRLHVEEPRRDLMV